MTRIEQTKKEPFGFGIAIELLKAGKLGTRTVWNGKHMYLGFKHGLPDQYQSPRPAVCSVLLTLPCTYMCPALG